MKRIATIVFPFHYQKNNKKRYLKALKLAEQSNAKVIFFTSLPKQSFEADLDKVYHHLLELFGYFQSHYYGWKKLSFPTERIVEKGDLETTLNHFMQTNQQEDLLIIPFD
ncbi:MAG: hypothetical protein ACI85Q_001849 [Salibacteraceae bacterium]|jgi:hypothetical protein